MSIPADTPARGHHIAVADIAIVRKNFGCFATRTQGLDESPMRRDPFAPSRPSRREQQNAGTGRSSPIWHPSRFWRSSSAARRCSPRAACPARRGTSSTSSASHCAVVLSGRTRMPLAQRIGPSFSATRNTSCGAGLPRCAATWLATVNTSHGPTKSNSSTSSKIRIPIFRPCCAFPDYECANYIKPGGDRQAARSGTRPLLMKHERIGEPHDQGNNQQRQRQTIEIRVLAVRSHHPLHVGESECPARNSRWSDFAPCAASAIWLCACCRRLAGTLTAMIAVNAT